MKKKDVVIGMKVVPHAKTVDGYGTVYTLSTAWTLSNKKYLYVTNRNDNHKCWSLWDEEKYINSGIGDFFHARDFEPYVEEPNYSEVLNSDLEQSLSEAMEFLKMIFDRLSDMTTNEFANGGDKEIRQEIDEFLHRK